MEIQEVAEPAPKPNQLVVDVAYAGVVFPDVLQMPGEYQLRPELPFTPGWEVSGVVRVDAGGFRAEYVAQPAGGDQHQCEPQGVAGRDPLQGGAIRRHYAPTGGTESLGTVAIAISTDLAMSVAKAVAAALTGSAGLFAETLHALADTGNQLLLLKGLRGSRRRPDTSHPFGYGAELFSWSLLAALSIVVVGGVLSIWEGSQRLLHPSGIQAGLVGVAVLGLGCLLDGTSWLASVRQLRREATGRGVRFRQHLRSTTDTAVTAVFYEDAAALLGNAIALTGLGLHQLLGSPAPDAAAGIMIGLLLASIGLRLAARNRALLTNRSESPVVLDRIRDLLVADPEVAAVGPVASVYLGPHPAPGHRRDPTAGRHLRAAPAAAPGRAPRARDGGDPARRPRLPDTGRHGRTTPGADAMGPGLLAATLPRPRAGMITGCAAAQDSQPQPGRHQRAGASGAEA